MSQTRAVGERIDVLLIVVWEFIKGRDPVEDGALDVQAVRPRLHETHRCERLRAHITVEPGEPVRCEHA